ncbi:hypothetical protein CQ10_32715 [Bradyrhizobium valentinum]|nr:hypothetical protein CQ10_32715 [Bradyrhizobium valentinum]
MLLAEQKAAGAGSPLLRLTGLSVVTRDDQRPILSEVDLTLFRGDALGVVGESGSGKSMTWLAVFGLLPKNTYAGGAVTVQDRSILGTSDREMSAIRGSVCALIPQEPMSSLNPVRTIGSQIVEVLKRKRGFDNHRAHLEAVRLLERVRIARAAERFRAYPHELSGGMCQRVLIAIALAGEPDLLVADEPTTALDVTVQAEILDLIRELQTERNMALVMISHDLGVVAQSCRDLMVMYAGKVVEKGQLRDIIDAPLHPYTRELVNAARQRDGIRKVAEGREWSEGTMPSVGCAFAPRCSVASERCVLESPQLLSRQYGRQVACHCAQ